jgi:hypothetical protein
VIGFGVGLLMSGIVSVAVALAPLPDEAVVAAVVAAGEADEPLVVVVAVEPDDEPELVVDDDEVVVLLLLPQASSNVPTTPTMPSTPPARSRPRRLSALLMIEKPLGWLGLGDSFISRFTFPCLLLDSFGHRVWNTDKRLSRRRFSPKYERRDRVVPSNLLVCCRTSVYSRSPSGCDRLNAGEVDVHSRSLAMYGMLVQFPEHVRHHARWAAPRFAYDLTRRGHHEHFNIGRSSSHAVNTPFSASRVRRQYTSKIAGIIAVCGTFASRAAFDAAHIARDLMRGNRNVRRSQ